MDPDSPSPRAVDLCSVRCNPRVLRDFLPTDAAYLTQLQASAPGLAFCIRTLMNMPATLERALGLPLRVPLNVLLASSPPGAAYRRHYDSYHGEDNPRLITILMYLAWAPSTGG